MQPESLAEYKQTVLAQLGAITAYEVLLTKESSKSIRDLAKQLADMSPTLRRELVETDKTLTVKHTTVDSDV